MFKMTECFSKETHNICPNLNDQPNSIKIKIILLMRLRKEN